MNKTDKLMSLRKIIYANQQLTIKCEDYEQHSRRSCLRIHGIESSDDEKIKLT